MAYNITLSDGTTIVTIPDGAIFNTYSVPLVGQNTSAYGDDVAAAFLRSLENFAYTSPPDTNPNIPGSVKLTGQLWYDTANAQLKVNDGADWAVLLSSAAGLTDIAGDITPELDSTYDIGTTGLRWAEGWFDNLQFGGTMTAEASSTLSVNGNLTTAGGSTVDLNGTITIDDATMDGKLTLADPDVISAASLKFAQASGAPAGAALGDMWMETDGLHIVLASGEEVLGVVGPAGGVTSFDGRSGAVVPWASDYEDRYPTLADFTGLGTGPTASATSTIQASANWIFNNRPAFNGGTSGATSPFTVDSTEMVANLTAQYLEGDGAPRDGNYWATDAEVVKLTGSQTIGTGGTTTKTFISPTADNTPAILIDISNGGADRQAIRIQGETDFGTDYGYISWYNNSGTTELHRIGITDEGTNSKHLDFWSNTGRFHFMPANSTSVVAEIWTGGLIINNSSGTQLLAASIPGGTQNTSIQVRDAGGADRNVGFNETPELTHGNGQLVLNATHVGKFIRRTSATADSSFRLDGAITQWPVGGSVMIHNDDPDGVCTLDSNSGALEWIDGSGVAPLTGDRTLAYNGLATIRKKSSNVYQVWGVGIT